MKILIAIDSYKDFASSRQIAEWLKTAITNCSDRHKIKLSLIGDGGEGTIEAIVNAKKGFIREFSVHDPLFRKINAPIGFYNSPTKTGIIEICRASGSAILLPHERNTMIATSYGTGEMILATLGENCRKTIIGLGGSIVSDGGMGMAQALGAVYLDKNGNALKPLKNKGFNALSLNQIYDIDLSMFDKRIDHAQFQIASDVSISLLGPFGQAKIFGPQKGATAEEIDMIEAGLNNWNNVLKKVFGKDFNIELAGAAGGLGAGLSAFLNGELRSGFDLVIEETGLIKDILWADVVIAGEGKLDSTSLLGKASIAVGQKARSKGKRLIGVFGTIRESKKELSSHFDHVVIVNKEDVDIHHPDYLGKTGPTQIQRAGAELSQFLH